MGRIRIKEVSDHRFVACSSAGVEHPAHTVTHGQKSLYLKDFSFNRIMLYGRTNQAQCLKKNNHRLPSQPQALVIQNV